MDRFKYFPLICVLYVRNAAHFGMPLRFLERLRRSNLPTINSTFHVGLSELCMVTNSVPSSIVVPPDVLPSLCQVHKMNSCVSFLDSFILDMLLLFVFWCHALAAICSPVHSRLLAKLQVLKDSDEAIERGSSRKIANLIQSKNQSIVQSRVQVLHRPKANTEADRWKLCQVARVTLIVPIQKYS